MQTIRIDPPLPSEVHQLAVSSGSQYAAVVGTFGVAVAELAGVPIGSRIVQVGPKPVKTKAELGAALGILPHGQVPSSALP